MANTTGGFDVLNPVPMDNRTKVANEASLSTICNAYEGLIVYIADIKKHIKVTSVTSDKKISTYEDFGEGGGIPTGGITASDIAANAVETAKIKDGAVTADKIDNEAISTGKIADLAVTSDKIANGAVGTDQIDDAAVTTDKIDDGAVTSTKIANDSVSTGKLADGSVTAAKLASSVEADIDKGVDASAKLDTFNSKGNATTPVFFDASGNPVAITSYGGNAATATKATQDADGNAFSSTYAKLASPALTGTPTAPTAASGTSTTQIATTAFVGTAVEAEATARTSAIAAENSARTAADTLLTNNLATEVAAREAAVNSINEAIQSGIGITTGVIQPTMTSTETSTENGVSAKGIADFVAEQKAQVQAEIDELSIKTDKVEETLFNNYVLESLPSAVTAFVNSSGKWIVSANYTGSFLAVSGGQKYRIKNELSNGYLCIFALLKSNSYSSGDSVQFCDGETKTHSVAIGKYEDIVVPDDCTYIWFSRSYEGNDRTATVYLIEETDKIADIQEQLKDISLDVVVEQPLSLSASMDASTKGATFVNNGDGSYTFTQGTAIESSKYQYLGTTPIIESYKSAKITFDYVVNGTINSANNCWFVLRDDKSWKATAIASVYLTPSSPKTGTLTITPYKLAGKYYITFTRNCLDTNSSLKLSNFKLVVNYGDNSEYVYNEHLRNDSQDTKIEQLQKDAHGYSDRTSSMAITWTSSNTDKGTVVNTGNGNCDITVINSASAARIGFSISKCSVGNTLKVSFDYTLENTTVSKLQDFYYLANQTDSTWISVTSAGTQTITDGHYECVITKDSKNYIGLSGYQYTDGTIIHIRNFKLEIMMNSAYVDSLSQDYDIFKAYRWGVNDCIFPTSYTSSKYMNLSSVSGYTAQGACVFGNFFIQGYAIKSTTSALSIYNLTTKTKVQDLTFSGISNTRCHGNSLQFGNKYYDSSDPFPILYLASGYSPSTTSTTTQIYGIRITLADGVYSASVVQTINFAFTGDTTWTESCIDADNHRTWIRYGTIWYCIPLPSVSVESITYTEEDATKSFRPVTMGWLGTSSAQGHTYYKGKIYYPSGIPTDEGVDSCYITVLNTRTQCRESVVWLADCGIPVVATNDTYEPESCFFWDGGFYVAFRKMIYQIIKQ